MRYFPQLVSGATVQYPVRKKRRLRTIVNVHADGSTRKLLDPSEAGVEWELAYSGLSGEERDGLESFFATVEGRLGTFTFLDPTDNLLLWSEQPANAAWVKGPMIQVAEGVADPVGTQRAARAMNGGAIVQGLEQAVAGLGRHHYCFSLYARSAQSSSLTLFRTTAGAAESANYEAGPKWERFAISGKFESSVEGVRFGMRLEAGASVDVYGMQAECQPAPSPYRKTTSRSGVYENARFEDDVLVMTAQGVDEHSCVVRVFAPVGT